VSVTKKSEKMASDPSMARSFRAYQRAKGNNGTRRPAVDDNIKDAGVRVKQATLRLLLQKAIVSKGAEAWHQNKKSTATGTTTGETETPRIPSAQSPLPTAPPSSSSPRRPLQAALATYDRMKAVSDSPVVSRVDQSTLRKLVQQAVVNATLSLGKSTRTAEMAAPGIDDETPLEFTAPAPAPPSPAPSRRSPLSTSRAPGGGTTLSSPSSAPSPSTSCAAALELYGRIKGEKQVTSSADRVDKTALRALVQLAVVDSALAGSRGAGSSHVTKVDGEGRTM